MSWRELEITQQSQCAIPSRRLNILPALPVYPLLSDITGPLLKSWRPTLKSRSTVATHIFHGRYVEWWMDPFMLLNYDCGSWELLECLWKVKIQLFIAPFACRGKHFRRTAVPDRSRFVLEWIIWGYRTLERAGFVFTAGSNSFLFVWGDEKIGMPMGKVSCICWNLQRRQHESLCVILIIGIHPCSHNGHVCLRRGKLGEVEYEEAAGGFVLNGMGYMWGSSKVRPVKRHQTSRRRVVFDIDPGWTASSHLIALLCLLNNANATIQENDDGKGSNSLGNPDFLLLASIQTVDVYNYTTQLQRPSSQWEDDEQDLPATSHFPPSAPLRCRQGTDKNPSQENFCVWGVPLIIFFSWLQILPQPTIYYHTT